MKSHSDRPPRKKWHVDELVSTFGKAEYEQLAAKILTELGIAGRWDCPVQMDTLDRYRVGQMIDAGFLSYNLVTDSVKVTDSFVRRLVEHRLI